MSAPHLTHDRKLVLAWLQGEHPAFCDRRLPAGGPNDHGMIARRFMELAGISGFGCKVVRVGRDGSAMYQVEWTHHGASFIGFKQPPPEASEEDALLAGCAALLQNEWCRARLPR